MTENTGCWGKEQQVPLAFMICLIAGEWPFWKYSSWSCPGKGLLSSSLSRKMEMVLELLVQHSLNQDMTGHVGVDLPVEH